MMFSEDNRRHGQQPLVNQVLLSGFEAQANKSPREQAFTAASAVVRSHKQSFDKVSSPNRGGTEKVVQKLYLKHTV